MHTPVDTAAQYRLDGVVRRFADRLVLDGVDLTLRPGERAGVVGDNGSGKTTLLRVLAGDLAVDAGERVVVAPGGIAVAHQHLDLPPTASVAATIDHVLAPVRAMERRLGELEAAIGTAGADRRARLLAEYADATAELEAVDGRTVDVRVATGLAVLGLGGLDRSRPVGTLSGGERHRLALAAALAAPCDLLLLDEPTNDLDDGAIAWLEDRLDAYRGTVVAVSHDRAFLDRLTSVILEVDDGRVRRYGGGYAGYLAARSAERQRRVAEHEHWRAELARHRRLIGTNAARVEAVPRKLELDGFGHGAFRARARGHGSMSRVRAAKEQVARLEAAPAPAPAVPLAFRPSLAVPDDGAPAGADRPPRDEGSSHVVSVEGLRVAGRLSLEGFRVAPGERVLVTGPNGAGKSTLLGVVAGEVMPDAGAVAVHGRVAHLRQEDRAGSAGVPLLLAYAEGRDGSLDEMAEELLATGLFRPDDLARPTGELSQGQRRRLELARAVAQPADLLLLDEPTNHLVPELVEQLEEALVDYPGAVVLVTHDRLLRARFRGRHVPLGG